MLEQNPYSFVSSEEQLETALLGTVLTDPSLLDEVEQYANEGLFSTPACQFLYRLMNKQFKLNGSFDLFTLLAEMRKGSLEAFDRRRAHLFAASTEFSSIDMYKHYLKMAVERMTKRKIASKTEELKRKLAEGDLNDVMSHIDSLYELRLYNYGEDHSWEELAALGTTDWVWGSREEGGWIGNGLVTMIAASPGAGKSWIMARLALTFTTGCAWPDGTPYTGPVGKVMWVEAESGQGLHYERALAMGVPLNMVVTPIPADQDVNLEDPQHRAALANLARNPEVVAIFVDSLSGVMPTADENKSESKAIVKFLAKVSKENRKPTILSHHLNKPKDLMGNEVTLERVRGSSSLVQFTRVVIAVDIPDANEVLNGEVVKRVRVIKANWTKPPAEMFMQIGDKGPFFFPRFETSQEASDKVEDCMSVLNLFLANGPRSQSAVIDMVRLEGISWAIVTEAARRLQLEQVKVGAEWMWRRSK